MFKASWQRAIWERLSDMIEISSTKVYGEVAERLKALPC